MKNKRFLRQGISAAICAFVIAGVIILNILCTLLLDKTTRYIDLSKENFYTLSEATRESLSELEGKDTDITIYFLADPDELADASLKGNVKDNKSSTWGMKYVYEMAKLFEREFNFIDVKTLDIARDSEFIRTAFASTVATEFTSLDVIIDSKLPDGTHNFRVCARDAFFLFDSESKGVYAARGDYTYTSNILSLSGNAPIAYFITGHGEKVGGETEDDFGSASAMAALFKEAGYTPKKIDLSKSDFPENEKGSDERAGVAVIFGAERDFLTDYNGSDVNEISRLKKYVDAENHHLMVFLSPNAENMPSLYEYMSDYFGVTFNRDTIVADTDDERTSVAIDKDGKAFAAAYATSDQSVGVSLTVQLLDNLDSIPDIYFANAGTISIDKNYAENTGSYDGERWSVVRVGEVFFAPELSASVDRDGKVDAYSKITYDRYYENIYDKEFELKKAELLNNYDTIYESAKENSYQSCIDDMYNSLCDEKLSELKEKYIFENIEGITDLALLEANAEKYALEALDKDTELLAGFEKKAKEYADLYAFTEEFEKEVKADTDRAINDLAKRHADSCIEQQDPAALMTLTYELWDDSLDKDSVPTYTLASASVDFASNEALTSSVYGNRDVLYYAMRLMGKKNVEFDTNATVIQSDALNTEGVNTVAITAVITALPAFLVLCIGAVVLIKRRKNR